MKIQKKYILLAVVVLVIAILLATRKKLNKLQKAVIFTAKKYVGQKEKPQNKGFVNSDFQSKMRSVGWWQNAEWCSLFGKLVFTEALPEPYKSRAKSLMNASSQQTFLHFANDTSGLFELTKKPYAGALIIWQSTKHPEKGHVGIVTRVKGNCIFTIEGNLNNKVSQNKVCYPYNHGDTLVLRGFIVPKLDKKALKQPQSVNGLQALNGNIYDKINNFIDKTLNDKSYKGRVIIGFVNKNFAGKINKAIGKDFTGQDIVIKAENVRKIFKDDNEITKEIFFMLIKILSNPQIVLRSYDLINDLDEVKIIHQLNSANFLTVYLTLNPEYLNLTKMFIEK